MTQITLGQVAAITGGAAGIGRALAEALAARGLRLALADADAAALEATGTELAARGAEVLTVPTDVADAEQMTAFRSAAEQRFGAIDFVFANAGIYPEVKPVWAIDLSDWRRLIEINYWGVVHTIREFVPGMVARGSGHMAVTASMSGLTVVPGTAGYVTAKHAVVALAETLRADLDLDGHRDIGVTILCPSIVLTQMGRRALGLFDDEGRETAGSGPDTSAAIEPEELVTAALAGIEAGDLYVMPVAGARQRIEKRIRPILDAVQDTP